VVKTDFLRIHPFGDQQKKAAHGEDHAPLGTEGERGFIW